MINNYSKAVSPSCVFLESLGKRQLNFENQEVIHVGGHIVNLMRLRNDGSIQLRVFNLAIMRIDQLRIVDSLSIAIDSEHHLAQIVSLAQAENVIPVDNESFVGVVSAFLALILSEVPPNPLVDDVHPGVCYPLFVLVLAVVDESLLLEVPSDALQPLLLHNLLDFRACCAQLLELLHLKLVKLSADRNLAHYSERIHFLLNQTHKSPFLRGQIHRPNLILNKEFLLRKENAKRIIIIIIIIGELLIDSAHLQPHVSQCKVATFPHHAYTVVIGINGRMSARLDPCDFIH